MGRIRHLIYIPAVILGIIGLGIKIVGDYTQRNISEYLGNIVSGIGTVFSKPGRTLHTKWFDNSVNN